MTAARFFRYRPLEPRPDTTVLARFDDGQPALAERRVGQGDVMLWASTLDNFWNDLALKSVYLPFVHRMVEHLADYTAPTPWFTAGQVLDLSQQRLPFRTGSDPLDLVALTPSGERMPLSSRERGHLLELTEQGIYEVRDANAADARAFSIAVNLDLTESDLSMLDPEELVGSITGRAGGGRAAVAAREIRPADLERRQTIWWYLLVAAFLLFVAETIVSNRLSLSTLD